MVRQCREEGLRYWIGNQELGSVPGSVTDCLCDSLSVPHSHICKMGLIASGRGVGWINSLVCRNCTDTMSIEAHIKNLSR